MKDNYFCKKRDINAFISFLIFSLLFIQINCSAQCPRDKPIFKSSKNACVMEYCTKEEYASRQCEVTNPVIKTQWINEFLYETEKSSPIYSSIGTNNEGDVFFESSLGTPYSTKRLFTLKDDGREYIDGIKRNIVNLGNNMFSKFGTGAVVTINQHKCYMKFAANESLEFYDFDDKKYTFANLKEKLGGYEIKSEKNTLIRTNVENTFIYAYISNENALMMQKFKIVSNDANNCIQVIKTLREKDQTLPTNTRSCMITEKQYIECLDINQDQMYVIRIYDSNLNFLKEYQLEKNNSPLNRAYYTYHETVWLKDEISIFAYYTDIGENGAKPIMVLKKLSVKPGQATLSNLNTYLTRDVLFPDIQYKFSDTENSLAIFNSYYYALTSITQGENQHLILALANIFNDDLTIDTHYFDVPLKDLYDINYQSGLRAFGFKNAYGVQMNYIHNNIPSSGFIVFGYANTTDPEPVNRLFDHYNSYTLNVRDYYKGIENNLFCYVFVQLEVTEIPSNTYFTVKTTRGTVRKGTILNLNDVITITKISGKNPPVGTYVLGIAPYLNEADYQGFKDCSIGSNMFGQQVPTDWYPDEYYGRTIKFKFTVGFDCFENCLECNEKGLELNDQKCTKCKNGYYFMEKTNNCFGEIPEGYYFNETTKTYMECYETCKTCSTKKQGNKDNCKLCKDNYLLYPNTNCLNCKYLNKYVNYEQTGCIDTIPDGYYVNDTNLNTIDKCYEKCKTCSEKSANENDMKCLTCDNTKGLYLLEGTNNCVNGPNEGEYIDDDGEIKKCNKACKTCSKKEILNDSGDVTNCDSCNNDEGYYLIEGTTICTKNKPDDGYYDDDCKCYKKCYKDCLTCSEKEIDKYHMNCLTCDNTKGYKFFPSTKNCLNCTGYVNYEQTGCIDDIPDGYYCNDTDLKTIDKCYEKCKTCSESSTNENDMKCLTCDNTKGLYLLSGTTNCVKAPSEGEYIDDDGEIKKCNEACKTCSKKEILNDNGDVTNCDSCNNDEGYYLIEGTTICTKNKPDDGYYDDDCKCYKKCYKDCLTCSEKEIDKYHMNCLTCDNTKGYKFFPSTKNCLNCKSINKYVNYDQTECIDTIPDGYYVNDTDLNTIDECHPNCLTCKESSFDDNDMKCLTCDNKNGYYFVEGTKNCKKIPLQGYYLEENILKKCYEDCLTCSAGPITNEKGKITNMNCDTCNELKGLYLIKGTKNCDANEDLYADICPEEKPILKDGKCILNYCTKEEYENNTCIISNPVIKNQWIDEFPYISEKDKPLYSTFGQMTNDDIIFETNIGNPLSKRYIYTLNEKGRGFFDGIPNDIIDLNSNLFSTNGNGASFKLNGNNMYMRLSNHETLELYDLDEIKYTFTRLEDKLGYKVESIKNSLLKTNDEDNIFIYAYITTGNHLIMSKFKIISNDANEGFELIKTSLEDFTTISKNSRRCVITQKQYIECIDLTSDQIYVIRLYDKELNFLSEYELEKNKAPKERAYYTYHDALWIREEVTAFVYYNDISDHNAKPIVIFKNLEIKNGKVNLINLSKYLDKEQLYTILPYIVSDSENSFAKINEYYYALATITSYENSHLLITVLNLYNSDNSLVLNYFDIPLKDLYDINYYSNLQAFGYKNTLGVQFEYKKGNEYRSGFIIFGFGNTTDPEPIDNIFENDKYIFNPGKYIKVQNNIFCYRLINIILSEIPDESTGIIIQRNNERKTVLKKGDILSINEEIIITYKGNKQDIPKGNYIIGFTPYLTEPDYEDHYQCCVDEENVGQKVPTEWIPDEYYGRTLNFEFSVGKCYEYCMTCSAFGTGIADQECDSCIEGFYFLEGTKNCYDKSPDGYYFDEEEEIHRKCYEGCETCYKKKEPHNHHCIKCKENYLLFKNHNCLNCKSLGKYINYEQTECIDTIPDGYYCNDTEINTIDKCYENCKTCKTKGTSEYNMECTSCDHDEGYFFFAGTRNCAKMPIPGYYIDKLDEKIRPCNIACATCTYKPLFNDDNEIYNCDTCNKDYGFYNKEHNSTICINKTKIGEYYDENCKCYKKCHKNCLTCSGSAIDEYHMNCLTCDSKQGYEFFSKTSNCLNCKAIGKKVNYDQTECIDDIPEGYYINDTVTNIVELCHSDCLTCSKAPTESNQNCLTCKPGLYLDNGNCIKTINCPYKFYYQANIDKNAISTQKICLGKDEMCPSSLPFYYTTTNECVETCPLDLLFYQGCKISNPNYGIMGILLLVKINYMQGLINSLSRSFSLYAFNNIVIKLSIFDLPIFDTNIFSDFRNLRNLDSKENNDDINSYQSLIDDNYIDINSTNDFEVSNINLGIDCEKRLRAHYKIPNDIGLTIIKLDYKKNDSKISNFEYEVFNPRNRSEKLDLSICDNVEVINPIKMPSYKTGIENGNILPYSEIDDVYNKDICSQFISENGAYVLPQDRIVDYNYEKEFCQNGCSFKEFDTESGNVKCLCPPNNGFGNINIDDMDNKNEEENIDIDKNKDNEEDKYNTKEYSYFNFKAFKCIKNMFSSKFAKNYIIIIITILLSAYLALSGIFIILFEPILEKLKKKGIIPSNPPSKNKKEAKKNKDENKTKDKNEKENNNKTEKKKKNQEKGKKGENNNNEEKEKGKKKKNKDNEKGIGNTSGRIINKSTIGKNEEIKIKDKDLFDYNEAHTQDQRKYIEMLFSSLKKRELVISIFNDEDNHRIIKAILLILSFINLFTVNSFFFSEINIHQIYIDKNVYNFGYQLKFIISSLILSLPFISIEKYFYNIRRDNIIFTRKIRFMILSTILSILFIFFWIYIGAVTSLYINIKKHLIINILLCYIFSFIFEALLSLISSTCRYFAIKNKNEKLYKISKIINLI